MENAANILLIEIQTLNKFMENKTSNTWNLIEGKYYTIVYKYKGKQFEEFACYKQFDLGSYYFKQDNGDWLILKPGQIISVRQ